MVRYPPPPRNRQVASHFETSPVCPPPSPLILMFFPISSVKTMCVPSWDKAPPPIPPLLRLPFVFFYLPPQIFRSYFTNEFSGDPADSILPFSFWSFSCPKMFPFPYGFFFVPCVHRCPRVFPLPPQDPFTFCVSLSPKSFCRSPSWPASLSLVLFPF